MHQVEIELASVFILMDLHLHIGRRELILLPEFLDLLPLVIEILGQVLYLSLLLVQLPLRFLEVLL